MAGLLLAASLAAAEPIAPHEVGVYGTLFDVCDYSVYKLIWRHDRKPPRESFDGINRQLRAADAAGKKNLLLIYPFDRVQHSRPLDEYVGNTQAILAGVDWSMVDAVCLSEENVTWNHGLAILNRLYDTLKAGTEVPVYQWLTNPDPPHPQLQADGWIIDPYPMDGTQFAPYLVQYLLTGKPVIDCITASPASSGAAWDHKAREQVEICRQFGVPMFFFCVDGTYGSPEIWLWDTDPETVTARDWLMRTIDQLRAEPSPSRLSRELSSGRAVEVAGGEDLRFSFSEAFGTTAFVPDLTIRGLSGVRWDGASGTLRLTPTAEGLPATGVQYHFVSPFTIQAPAATLVGRGPVEFAISGNGHSWTRTASEGDGPFELTADLPEPADKPLREVYLRVTPRGGEAAIDQLTFTGRSLPPDEPVTTWRDIRGGKVTEETFQSEAFRHLADIEGAADLTWRRGAVELAGVAGRTSRTTLRWRIVSPVPLSRIASLEVQGRANGRNLGGTNRLRLLLPDGTELARDSTAGEEGNASGWVTRPLTASVDLPAPVRELVLEVEMINTSGVATRTSNAVTGWRLIGLEQAER